MCSCVGGSSSIARTFKATRAVRADTQSFAEDALGRVGGMVPTSFSLNVSFVFSTRTISDERFASVGSLQLFESPESYHIVERCLWQFLQS
jgi:hypothetical protein